MYTCNLHRLTTDIPLSCLVILAACNSSSDNLLLVMLVVVHSRKREAGDWSNEANVAAR